MYIISSTDLIPFKNWNTFLKNNLFGNYFQAPEFIEFITNLSNHKPLNLFAVDSNHEICGTLCGCIMKSGNGIKGFLSKRIIIWGGPLALNQESYIVEKLLNYLITHFSSKCIYIEFRNSFNISDLGTISKFNNFRYLPYLNIVLNIENKTISELLSKMTYNRRREIKLSLSENASYREAISIEEVKKVYQLLINLYKSKLNLPIPRSDFFNAFFNDKNSKLFIVMHNNNIVGGSFCKLFNNKIIYTWYYCGKRDYHKKIFPTHLAVLAAIEYGVENGFSQIDLMGGGIKGENYGVRDYKMQFGAGQFEFGRYIKINNKFLYHLGKIYINLKRKMAGFNYL